MNKYLIDDERNYSFKKNKLIRANNYNDSIIIFSDDSIKTISKENIKLLDEKIKKFLTILDKNCNNFNSDLFIKNFKKTTFEIGEYYSPDKKHILGCVTISHINNFYLKTFDVVNHELLHLSSIKKDIYDDLFFAYEEAYTKLLTKRYFNEQVHAENSVDIIIKYIETIIGKDVMEKKYFKGELYSTIKYLYKYETKENICKLLMYLKEIYYNKNTAQKNQDFINKCFEIIFNCLENKIKIKSKREEMINLLDKDLVSEIIVNKKIINR